MFARHLLHSIGLSVFALTSLISTSNAGAQSGMTLLTAEIPFAFEVGRDQMPAGSYTLNQPLQTFLRLQASAKGSKATSFQYTREFGARLGRQTLLRFHCYEDRCFLRRVQMAEMRETYDIPASKQEKRLQRERMLASAATAEPAEAVVAAMESPSFN